MGAYGNAPEATSKSRDTDADGLPDDWERRWFGDLSEGALQGNIIAGNWANYDGGGLCECDGTVLDNVIVGNRAAPGLGWGGGGLLGCSGTIEGNKILNNYAGSGGGAANLRGTVVRNIIAGNLAESEPGWGYGGGLVDCEAAVQNNLIVANRAANSGGGMDGGTGSVFNNTVARNSAGTRGGGISGFQGVVTNCIIWGNTAPDGPQVYRSTTPSFSCIQNWGAGGEGNIAENPLFVGVPRTAGQWTENATFDDETWQTTLVDAGASWETGALTGLLIDPDTGQSLQFLIASNTEATITVWGDASQLALAGKSYEMYDYHLDVASPCVDSGDNTVAIGRLDLGGNFRYVDTKGKSGWTGGLNYIVKEEGGAISLMWKGVLDIGPYECQVFGSAAETFIVQTRDSMDSGEWVDAFTGKVPMWTDEQAAGKQKFYRVGMEWPALTEGR